MAFRNTLRLLAVLAIGAALSAACIVSSDDDSLDEGDAGSTQTMKVGDELVVELEGNPTTGYTWEVATIDDAVLRQEGEADFDPDSDAEGSGGTVTLHFKALAPGTTTLELVYRRSFEDNAPAEKTWQITVAVEE